VTGFDDLPRLRQPEYTGENRCWPCTVANLCIGGLFAVAAAFLTGPLVGAAVFGGSALVTYLRGYLVPGTPTLTERYLPSWSLRAFGKEPVATTDLGDRPAAEDDPLVAAGIVERGDGVTLTPPFREAWRERMAAVGNRGVDPEDVAAAFDADSAAHLGARSFDLDGTASVRWGSVAALVADVAAANLLADRLEGWSGFDRETRRSVLLGLRLCLETCPECGGPIQVTIGRVDPCCQKPHLTADALCGDCGAPIADAAVVDSDDTTIRESLLEL
jgi:hypothetical protein